MKQIKIIPSSKESLFAISIDQSKLFLPSWYKKTKARMTKFNKTYLVPNNAGVTTATHKQCVPLLDAFTNGYIFSLAQDMEVTITDEGQPFVMWRLDENTPVSWNTNDQWEGFYPPEECHKFLYKWENPFIIKTPKKYSILFTHPHNRFDLPFITLNGIVDTDKYDNPIHFPFYLKKGFTGIIKAGTPLAQITFIKRERWFRTVTKYNEKKTKKDFFDYFGKIERPYKRLIWQRKEYE